jgi:hypothetical protein
VTLGAHRSIPTRLAALLAAAALLLFAPFATLCVAGGHAGIEFLFMACCGSEPESDRDCAGDCTDTLADFGASLAATAPVTVVPALQSALLLPEAKPTGPCFSVRADLPAKSLQHASLAAVFLLS